MLKLSSIFILLFITLGPIKTIVPFVQLTADADAALCRTVALRLEFRLILSCHS